MVKAFLCADPSCANTLSPLLTTQTDANGQFTFTLDSGQVAGKRLVFDATIIPAASALITKGRAAGDTAVDYRIIDFGPIGVVTSLDVVIDPISEAAVRLVEENGAQHYSDQGIHDVIQVVRTADEVLDFGGVSATDALNLATETARSDPMVQDALHNLCTTGDCSGNFQVTVDELLTLVNIALGNAQPSACPHGIPSGAEVNITVIIQAVNNALNGCGS